MGLLDFFRRKKRPSGPNLKDIWRGFQRVLALNNEIQALMGYLEEKLAAPGSLDLDTWRVRIDLLDRRFADLVAALQGMVGDRWQELEAARNPGPGSHLPALGRAGRSGKVPGRPRTSSPP